MKLACPVCHAKYTISDERLDGRRVRVRCKRCGETFAAGPTARANASPEVSAAEVPASVPPAAEREDVWARTAPSRRGAGADLFAPASEARDADGPSLTGERNETSVLFSLATLTQVAPPSPASSTQTSSESSSLIDLRALAAMEAGGDASASDAIAHLGGGGPFAPILAPPVLAFAVPEDPAPRPVRALRPAAIGVGLALVAVVGGVAFAGVHALSAPSPAPVAVDAHANPALNVGAAPALVESSAKDEGTAPAHSSPDVPLERAPKPQPPSTGVASNRTPLAPPSSHASSVAASTGSAIAPSKPTKCCPGEDETMCAMRVATGALCAGETAKVGPAPFDRAAASRALGVSVASCKRPDGPSGPGHVKVVFQPSGVASSVEVDPPYAGTASGACVVQRYRGVTVPAFSGGQLVVGKTFTLP